jgi:hypothetical protein
LDGRFAPAHIPTARLAAIDVRRDVRAPSGDDTALGQKLTVNDLDEAE